MLFDLALQFGGVGHCGIERDITAGNQRRDVAKAELAKQGSQMIHFDGPAADVDGTKQRNVARNGTPPDVRPRPREWLNSSSGIAMVSGLISHLWGMIEVVCVTRLGPQLLDPKREW